MTSDERVRNRVVHLNPEFSLAPPLFDRRLIRIATRDDPRITEFRAIPDPALVREQGLFVAEGRLVVRRLLAERRFRLRALLLTETALARLWGDAALPQFDGPIYVTSRVLLRDIGGYEFHQGCLGLAERPRPRPLLDMLAAVDRGQPLVILERVGNPDNIGAIFRNAAAFGAGAVLLSSGCGDPLYRKSIRTSIGSVLHVPYAVLDDWAAGMRAVRRRGYTVVGLTPDPRVTPLAPYAATVNGAVALLLGNEGEGLSPGALAEADALVRVPVEPPVDSLNVATAAAIALYAFRTRG